MENGRQPLRIYLGNLSSEISFYLPYTAGVLRASIEQDPDLKKKCEFPKFFFHSLNGVDALMDDIDAPDVLGLSLYVWNQERSLKLARLVKEKFPHCLVVFGGPQAPSTGEKEWLAKNPQVDVLVHKEGEVAFREIIRQLTHSSPNLHGVNGITFRTSKNEIHRTPPGDMTRSLQTELSPYLLGFMDDCIQEAKTFNRPIAAVIETCRGCPYSCTFCDWGNNAFNKLRQFDFEKVKNEIDFLAERVEEIYVADANFGIFPRDLEIANHLVKAAKKFGRLKTVQVIMAKQKSQRTIEIAKLLSDAHLTLLGETIGIQSTTPSVLKNVKRNNIPLGNLQELVRQYRAEKIPFYIELILGLPGESKETFLDTLENVLSADAQDVRVYNLALLPNSELAQKSQRREFGIQSKMTKIIEGPDGENEYSETVMGTKDLPPTDYKMLRELSLLIDVFHGGRWTYFLAWYLKKELNVPFTQFYQEMLAYFSKPERAEQSAAGRVLSGWYIRNFNSGFYNKFHGPHSPHGVDWSGKFFFKQTFFWLSLSEDRQTLANDLAEFLGAKYTSLNQELIADLVRFQMGIIFDPNDGVSPERELKISYNWPKYFELSGGQTTDSPQQMNLTLKFGRSTVGRRLASVNGPAQNWIFEAAGGAYFDKINRFINLNFSMQPALID